MPALNALVRQDGAPLPAGGDVVREHHPLEQGRPHRRGMAPACTAYRLHDMGLAAATDDGGRILDSPALGTGAPARAAGRGGLYLPQCRALDRSIGPVDFQPVAERHRRLATGRGMYPVCDSCLAARQAVRLRERANCMTTDQPPMYDFYEDFYRATQTSSGPCCALRTRLWPESGAARLRRYGATGCAHPRRPAEPDDTHAGHRLRIGSHHRISVRHDRRTHQWD